jgi:hypothetical protein
MRTNFHSQEKYGLAPLSLLGSLLIFLPLLFISVNSVGAQNQLKEEKTIMQASGKNIPPLDLQVWAQTETATFALG